LIKLRQFGELLAQLVAVEVGIQGEGSQQDLLRLLGDRSFSRNIFYLCRN
jgi:hypothetical protein